MIISQLMKIGIPRLYIWIIILTHFPMLHSPSFIQNNHSSPIYSPWLTILKHYSAIITHPIGSKITIHHYSPQDSPWWGHFVYHLQPRESHAPASPVGMRSPYSLSTGSCLRASCSSGPPAALELSMGEKHRTPCGCPTMLDDFSSLKFVWIYSTILLYHPIQKDIQNDHAMFPKTGAPQNGSGKTYERPNGWLG